MGAWYTIGLLVGAGAALGVAATAILRNWLVAAAVAAVAAAAIGYAVFGWPEAVGGAAGGVLGAFGSGPIVAGSLRRGGTRFGTAAILALVALVVAGLAFVPVLGYLEAAAVPLFGMRLKRSAPERHAGLRTLAKD
jgi:hypothetical protein